MHSEGAAPVLASISRLSRHETVYEPSDDSYALVDVLANAISDSELNPAVCVEIGSGSGYVVCSLALLLQQRNIRSHCIAIDVNPCASACTLGTLAAHEIFDVEVATCDLMQPFLPRLTGKVDLLVFNPPYVPTPEEEVSRKGISQAWAGGFRGRVVIDRILPQVAQILSPSGTFFMVAVADNDPEASVVHRREADEERLSVIRATFGG